MYCLDIYRNTNFSRSTLILQIYVFVYEYLDSNDWRLKRLKDGLVTQYNKVYSDVPMYVKYVGLSDCWVILVVEYWIIHIGL